jgi:hypothetical protein
MIATRSPARDASESLASDVAVPQPKWLHQSNIDNILSTVGPKYIPADLDTNSLLYDLNGAWNFYHTQLENSPGRRTALLRYATRVIRAANSLSEILKQSHQGADALHRFLGDRFVDDLQVGLQRLSGRAKMLQSPYSSPIPTAFGLRPREFFLGYDLPRIFEKHFRREAGRSKAPEGGPPTGPFIRFAVAVSKELGQHTTAETIDRARKATKRRGLRLPSPSWMRRRRERFRRNSSSSN